MVLKSKSASESDVYQMVASIQKQNSSQSNLVKLTKRLTITNQQKGSRCWQTNNKLSFNRAKKHVIQSAAVKDVTYKRYYITHSEVWSS